jgi:hypothetical protein
MTATNDWTAQFTIEDDTSDHRQCDGCAFHYAPSELYDGGNGGFYCAECKAEDGDDLRDCCTYEDHLIDVAWREDPVRVAALAKAGADR